MLAVASPTFGIPIVLKMLYKAFVLFKLMLLHKAVKYLIKK